MEKLLQILNRNPAVQVSDTTEVQNSNGDGSKYYLLIVASEYFQQVILIANRSMLYESGPSFVGMTVHEKDE